MNTLNNINYINIKLGVNRMENWTTEKLRRYYWTMSDNQGNQGINCSDNKKRLQAKQILIERMAW